MLYPTSRLQQNFFTKKCFGSRSSSLLAAFAKRGSSGHTASNMPSIIGVRRKKHSLRLRGMGIQGKSNNLKCFSHVITFLILYVICVTLRIPLNIYYAVYPRYSDGKLTLFTITLSKIAFNSMILIFNLQRLGATPSILKAHNERGYTQH